MIFSETFWIVMAIFFWVLLALIVVTFIADTYVKIVYYKWDKDEREENIMKDKVGEMIEEKINPGGGISELEN